MSKLADAIRRSQRAEAAPMGFGAARGAPKPTMLVGYLTSNTAAAGKARDAGADVILLDSRGNEIGPAEVKDLHAAAGETPVGVWAPMSGETADLQAAGLDFLAFDPDATPAAALLNENIGYLLVLPKEPDELFLRSLESLTLDGLYLSEAPSPLTVSRQIELTRVGMFARKPLICQVKSDIAKEELQCLRAAGVVLLLVDGEVDRIGRLHEAVLALPARRQRREERPIISLPRGQTPAEEEDDDDDD